MSMLCLAAGVGIALSPMMRKIRTCAGSLWSIPEKRFITSLFVVSLLINLGVAFFMFHAIPRLDDGVGALFQARIFACFRITLPLPPNPGFYEQFGVLGQAAGLGHWCGMYPPG